MAEAKVILDLLIVFCGAKVTADRTAALRCCRYAALQVTDGNGPHHFVVDVVR